jgi:hypothetical protein
MRYAKAWLVVLATGLAALQSAVVGGLDRVEVVQLGLVLLGAFTVAVVPNMSEGVAKYAKTIAAVAFAVLNVLVTAIIGGLDTQELINLALAALAAVGVLAVENKPSS